MRIGQTFSRWTTAVAVALTLALGGCTVDEPQTLDCDAYCRNVMSASIYICLAGHCDVKIERECEKCEQLWIDVTIREVVAKAGVDYEPLTPSRFELGKGVKTRTVPIKLIPRKPAPMGRTFEVEVAVDGRVAAKTSATITDA